MGELHLTAFDLAVIVIILISSIMAFARGLLREVFSIVAFLGAIFVVALEAQHRFLSPIAEGFIQPSLLADIATWILLFIVVFTVINVLTSMVAKAAHKSGEIGAIDRGAGLLFGAARGVLALAFVVLLMDKVTPADRRPEWLANARTYPVLAQAAEAIKPLISLVPGYIQDKRSPESPPAGTTPT